MNLDDSIRTGFVDKRAQSFASLQPGFIINGNSQKVLGHLDRKIRESNRFWFSVAFITSSGVMSLHEALKQFCQNTNNKGKIFVSDYLGFTAPEALKKINENFEYLDVRMYRGNDYHGKGFYFRIKKI